MKSALGMLAGLLLSASTFGQGTVNFSNLRPDYRLFTISWAGPTAPVTNFISGPNAYRIGLYTGPNGASEASLTLVGLATNAAVPALAGYFNGGNPYSLPAGYPTGTQIAFQIRAWSFGGGLDYATALADPSVVVGKSPLGFTTLGGGVYIPGALFGTNPGQLSSGFLIGGVIPEPATRALAVLGAVTTGLFLRRPKTQSRKFGPPQTTNPKDGVRE